MPQTMKELGIDRLSVNDRLALVEEIWESISASPDQIPLTETEKQLLDRRLADLEANPENVSTWEDIKARIRGHR